MKYALRLQVASVCIIHSGRLTGRWVLVCDQPVWYISAWTQEWGSHYSMDLG